MPSAVSKSLQETKKCDILILDKILLTKKFIVMTIIEFIEKETGVQNLAYRSWQDIVDNVILPDMAYRADQRNRIGSSFMRFMSLFPREVMQRDARLGAIMMEIAMQRISDGAVLHPDDPTPTFDALPREYRTYASQNGYQGGEPGLMGKECEDFIVRALPVALEYEQTRKHALAIAFGLVRYLSPAGEPQEGYMFGCLNHKPDGVLLYALGNQWVEKYASKEEIFRHYAQPAQWQRHLDWFQREDKASRLDWKQFFASIRPEAKENIFSRWRRQGNAKAQIRRYVMPATAGFAL